MATKSTSALRCLRTSVSTLYPVKASPTGRAICFNDPMHARNASRPSNNQRSARRTITSSSTPRPRLPACRFQTLHMSRHQPPNDHTTSIPRQTRGINTSTRTRKSPTDSRGPVSTETTQTDLGAMDILANMSTPTTAIDACLDNGFALNSGLKTTGGGVLLVGGEAFGWLCDFDTGGRVASRPFVNAKGQFDLVDEAAGAASSAGTTQGSPWGILDLVWPRPDLLVIGTGKRIRPVSSRTRRALADLGIRLEVLDTRNAAAQFNLLATERGIQQVAAALVPVGREK